MQLCWYSALIVSKQYLLPWLLTCLKVWFCCCRRKCESPIIHFHCKIQSLNTCSSHVCYWNSFENWILLPICSGHTKLQCYNFDCQYLCPCHAVDVCVSWTHRSKGNWPSLSLSLLLLLNTSDAKLLHDPQICTLCAFSCSLLYGRLGWSWFFWFCAAWSLKNNTCTIFISFF